MKAKLKNYSELFFQPKKFFSRIDTRVDYLTPLLFYAFLFAVYHVIDLFLAISYFSTVEAVFENYVAIIVMFLFNMALVWLVPFIQGLLIHSGAVFFGVTDYFKTFQAAAYGFTVIIPYLVIGNLLVTIPGILLGFRIDSDPNIITGISLIFVAGFIHSIYATARGLEIFDGFSFTKALVAVLFIPLLLLVLILASMIISLPFVI